MPGHTFPADNIPATANRYWSPTPIIGYRFWTWKPAGVTGSTGFRWDSPVAEALCELRRKTDSAVSYSGAPHLRQEGKCGGNCGIYCFTLPGALVHVYLVGMKPIQREVIYQPRNGPELPEVLLGAVALTGRVVQHFKGYRAQRAEVVGLVTPRGTVVHSTTDPMAIHRVFAQPDIHSDTDWTQTEVNDTSEIPKLVVSILEEMQHGSR